MEFETIIFRKEDDIGILQLNRPKQLNAISMQMRVDIEKVLEISIEDKEIKAIILTGGTECFCSGADVREKDGIIQRLNDSKMYRILTRRKIIHSLIEECEIPVIAAITGLAVGGGLELALACDIRIASDAARFGATEINFGTLPSGGGTQRLPRVIGMERAKEMIFTGNIINAQEALTIGLISRIVKREMLMAEAKALASKIAEKSPLAVKMAKFAINKGVQMDINSALDYEAQCVTVLHGTEDRKEALQAFTEKRKPVFKGK